MDDAQRMTAALIADPTLGRERLAVTAGVSEGIARGFLERNTHRKEFVSVAKLCDWHVPYHDAAAVDCAIRFCEKVQPNVILIDEIHDFYSLSRFSQDPIRQTYLQDEIDIATGYFKRLREGCPGSRIILLNSNHLDRLRRFLWTDGQALASLRCLQVEELLQLKQIGLEYAEHFEYKDVLFKHGDLVRKYAAYTAKGEFEKEGCSGASGHTHRLGVHYTTKRGGKYVWVEGGCLCDLAPEYISGVADWQHGVTLFTFERDGMQYFPQAIPIIDGKMIYGGELI